MFDPTEYAGMTWKQYDRAERAARIEREEQELGVRMDAFRQGLVSKRAAIDGGSLYEQELAETRLELVEESTGISTRGIAQPMREAITGFFAALDAARKAA